MSSLSVIMPKKRNRVIDLVSAAGVNVDDWGNFKGGPKNAASNPKYCYEWAFVEPQKVIVLSLWHAALDERDGRIVRDFNIRKSAQDVPGNSIWSARASRMDKAIQQAIESKLPIRVMLCSGFRRGISRSDNDLTDSRNCDIIPIKTKIISFGFQSWQ